MTGITPWASGSPGRLLFLRSFDSNQLVATKGVRLNGSDKFASKTIERGLRHCGTGEWLGFLDHRLDLLMSASTAGSWRKGCPTFAFD